MKKDDLMDCDRRTHLNFSVLTKSGEKRRVFHYCNDGLTVMYGLDVLGSLKLTMYINIPEHTPFNLEPEPHSLIRRSPYRNYLPVFLENGHHREGSPKRIITDGRRE